MRSKLFDLLTQKQTFGQSMVELPGDLLRIPASAAFDAASATSAAVRGLRRLFSFPARAPRRVIPPPFVAAPQVTQAPEATQDEKLRALTDRHKKTVEQLKAIPMSDEERQDAERRFETQMLREAERLMQG